MWIYFIFSYLETNSMTQNVLDVLFFLKYYYLNLQYSLNEIAYLNTALCLNKTNVYDDYFNQSINLDKFNGDVCYILSEMFTQLKILYKLVVMIYL